MKTNSKHLENQLSKTKAAMTGEEIRAFAEEGKIELSPELLEAINGGVDEARAYWIRDCQNCGSTNLDKYLERSSWYGWAVKCRDCGWYII